MVTCGRCSREMLKGHKRHRDILYCSTCYQRLFKRGLCPGCGNFHRLLIDEPSAICTACEKARPCVRCHRIGRPIGKMTSYGPACTSCYRHFATARPCGSCGESTVDWYRPAKDEQGVTTDIDAPSVCVRCAGIYKNCWVCHRSRRCTDVGDGNWACDSCLTGEASNCIDCAREIPKASGPRCPDCYWTGRCHAHARQLQFIVPEGDARQAFLDFVAWAVAASDPKRVALGLTRHVEFFAHLARLARADWNSEQLLRLFGADGLRTYELAARWVERALAVTIAPAQRLESAERRRVREQLGEVPVATAAASVIQEFADAQLARLAAAEVSARTVRTSLRPAIDLMRSIAWRERPQQADLERYLAVAPGQRAALFAFVTFLRARHAAELVMPKPKRALRANELRRAQERHLNKLLDQIPRAANFEREWLAYSLAYFHRVSLVKARTLLANGKLTTQGDGFLLAHEIDFYWLPRPPEPVAPVPPPEATPIYGV